MHNRLWTGEEEGEQVGLAGRWQWEAFSSVPSLLKWGKVNLQLQPLQIWDQIQPFMYKQAWRKSQST